MLLLKSSKKTLRELMQGSDFKTIVNEMNHEYGIPYFDEEDDPADMKLEKKDGHLFSRGKINAPEY